MRALRRLAAAVLMFSACGAWAANASLTLQDAIAKVERDTAGKVLSAETKHTGRQTIYRIKVLTHNGQVKVVEVPADPSR